MKYTPGYLDSFISPITGTLISNTLLPLDYNYILIGDRAGNSVESPALIDIWLDIRNIKEKLSATPFILQTASPDFINSQALDQVSNGLIMNNEGVIIPASLTYNNFWIGNSDNIPVETNIFPIGSLPNLTYQNIWLGDNTNRAVATSAFNGNFYLQNKYIWRGNSSNLVIPVNDLTILEGTVESQGTSILGLISGLSNLVNIVNGLTSTVNAIEAGFALIGGFPALVALIANVAALDIAVPATNARIDNLTLDSIANNKATAGDVNINNHKLINVANASNPLDAVNLQQLQSLNTTLTGAVSGSGNTITGIFTTFNLHLNQIPLAMDYVDLNNNRIINVSDPIDSLDAVNLETLISYIDDVPGSITITLGGAVSGSGLSTTTIMTTLNTTLDAVPLALNDVNINTHKLTNVSNPSNPLDAVNLQTLQALTITLSGAVSGSGDSLSPIVTTLNTTLDAVPLAVANVNINNNKLVNVSDPTNPLDAVNLEYLESYIIDNVTPILYVDGNSQTIYYDSEYKTTTLNVLNNSTPAIGNSSHNNLVLTTLYGALTLEWSSFVYSSLATAPVFSMYYDSDIADITHHPFLSVIANDSDLGSEIEIDLNGRTIIDTQGSYFSILHNGNPVFDIEQDGDVNCNDNAIIDLKTLSFSNWSDMEAKAQYAPNYLFLWEFFGGGVS